MTKRQREQADWLRTVLADLKPLCDRVSRRFSTYRDANRLLVEARMDLCERLFALEHPNETL